MPVPPVGTAVGTTETMPEVVTAASCWGEGQDDDDKEEEEDDDDELVDLGELALGSGRLRLGMVQAKENLKIDDKIDFRYVVPYPSNFLCLPVLCVLAF